MKSEGQGSEWTKRQPLSLKNFDDAWNLGDPALVEAELSELLAAALTDDDKSIYPQILSQIALAQAMQQNLNEAHATLDKAEAALTKDSHLAKTRILLNRGKVFQQSEQLNKARDYFEQAFQLASHHNYHTYAIDAAHMIAIITEENHDKIHWNTLAIELASTKQAWLGTLYNNLGQNLLEAARYHDALDAFNRALAFREAEGDIINIRVARWAIACTLRKLDRIDEALNMQLSLFTEYETKTPAVPTEIYHNLRGFVSEELAELFLAKSNIAQSIRYANIAIADLSRSKDPIFIKSVASRLERLQQIKNQSL